MTEENIKKENNMPVAERTDDEKTMSQALTEKQVTAILRKDAFLNSAIMTEKVINVRVRAVVEEVREGKTVVCANALTSFGSEKKYEINIPFDDMYTSQIINPETVNLDSKSGEKKFLLRQKQIMTKLIGVEIAVIVYGFTVVPDTNEIKYLWASRKKALAKIRKDNFIDNVAVEKGEFYNGTIISVGPHAIAITFKGVDMPIQQFRLTEKYISDLNKEYRAGDVIRFKLNDFTVGEDDSVQLTIDAIAAELEKAKDKQHTISKDTVCKITITKVYTANDRYIIYGWLPDWELPVICAPVSMDSLYLKPKAGDDAIVIVTGYQRAGRINARIIRTSSGLGTYNR